MDYVMSNFAFLQTDFPTLLADAAQAESLAHRSPKAAAVLARVSLEAGVNWLYDHDRKLTRPWKSNLDTLMHETCFQALFSPSMFRELNLIRKLGNVAAHAGEVSADEILSSLKCLFRFWRFVAIYYGKTQLPTQTFDESLIPHEGARLDKVQIAELIAQAEEHNTALREKAEQERKLIEQNEALKKEIEEQRAQLAALVEHRQQTVAVAQAIPLAISEAKTRKMYIDLSLREAGWTSFIKGQDIEFEVNGMPVSTNRTGVGYVDYVLWGDDGQPLALVEAKKTMADARQGREQARLYADCLQVQFGVRPIVFYSNGFETYLWDDAFYPERQVAGFYTKDELMWLMARRSTGGAARTDLRDFVVNTEIAGRPYQLQAVKRLAETFAITDDDGQLRGRARKALLVMATGSGKTRTAAAIVDMLSRCHWVKRVLFLADRTNLVTQAKNAFNEYLPELSAIDLTREYEDSGTRLVFSTYQTVMNKIDKFEEHERFYGVGHFDLIIVDEAHRSVYQKYRAIFEYFDALMVGLTATPKTSVDRNTYELFGIEDHNPTFAYELDTAVNQKYLVPPIPYSVPLHFQREGVKYFELSDAEKLEYEEKFGDPTNGEAPDEIGSNALNQWLFNTGTVDEVLRHLMTKGIKVAGGDVLGKTIIFARNHKHAEFINERFNVLYPQYGGEFLRVIDNYESKAQSLLEKFTQKHKDENPQIAVSVDMMDTGVDAVRVVNLVFFKPVKSATKFWQMVGRGTRLCPDLFAVGENKQHFAIFDFCENFEFFGEKPNGIEPKPQKGLSQQIFEAKLEIALLVRNRIESDDDERALAERYIGQLYEAVANLDQRRFEVKAKLRTVTEYERRERWDSLSQSDKLEMFNDLSGLLAPIDVNDELALRFDVLILNYQLALLSNAKGLDGFSAKVVSIATQLLKKQNIPEVGKQKPLLENLLADEYWEAVNVNELEIIRVALRDLIKYLDREDKQIVVTHFNDTIDIAGITVHPIIESGKQMHSYKERVEAYIRKNEHLLVIQKLKSNKQITRMELEKLEEVLFDGKTVGTREDYVAAYGDKPLGQFIRSIVGLDVKAVQAAFAEFLQVGHLTGDQMTFVENIINYFVQNGVVEVSKLFEPPFTYFHDDGVYGIFDSDRSDELFRVIKRVNENALVA